MAKRDGFSEATLNTLGRRAGFHCSHPQCFRLTVGPSDDRNTRITMAGVGAHITGASPGGARYDASLSSAKRASEANGIWMCQTHAKWIDDNPSKATVALLQKWKLDHEAKIAELVETGKIADRAGLASITLHHVGILSSKQPVTLSRFNVVYGRNASGKSTLCEALAAFGGGRPLAQFCERFDMRGVHDRRLQVSAVTKRDGKSLSVTLVRAEDESRRRKPRPGRMQVEVDGSVAIDWPRQNFRSVIVSDIYSSWDRSETVIDGVLREIATVFGMQREELIDGLRPDLFATAPLGHKFRVRRGAVEVWREETGEYQPGETLSGGEMQLAAAELVLRLLKARSEHSWLLLLDSGFFLSLDEYARRLLIDAALSDNPKLQMVVCVNEEEQATPLSVTEAATWVGASQLGDLTIHHYS